MSRYTIRFDSKTAKTLERNAAEKEITTTHYVRNLVDIGLRVEQANAKKHQTSDDLKTIIDLLTVAPVGLRLGATTMLT